MRRLIGVEITTVIKSLVDARSDPGSLDRELASLNDVILEPRPKRPLSTKET